MCAYAKASATRWASCLEEIRPQRKLGSLGSNKGPTGVKIRRFFSGFCSIHSSCRFNPTLVHTTQPHPALKDAPSYTFSLIFQQKKSAEALFFVLRTFCNQTLVRLRLRLKRSLRPLPSSLFSSAVSAEGVSKPTSSSSPSFRPTSTLLGAVCAAGCWVAWVK